MTAVAAAPKPAPAVFERFLSLWVAACILAGVALGYAAPGAFAAIEAAHLNLVVAALVWLMIIPMLLKVDLGALGVVRWHWKAVAVKLVVNWAVKPFSMALLAALFLGWLLRPLLLANEVNSYVAGIILVAAVPCTAMVFVSSSLCEGDPAFTLSQVALNDIIMFFAFPPIVTLLLWVASVTVP